MKKLALLLTSSLFWASAAQAKDLVQDLNSLGANEDLIKKVRAYDPDNKVKVVQKRAVDRNWRLEFGVNYGAIAGGDPYTNSQNIGGNLDLHISPKFSLGVRYSSYDNQLNSEGERVFEEFESALPSGALGNKVPFVDSPVDSTLAVATWYPIYGKLNLFDMGIAQFDLYTLAGYGQMRLTSGNTETFTLGGGVGIWLSQHFSTRFEMRYQNYEDQFQDQSRSLDLTVISASLGFLL